jgi:hypothetical protein
MAAKKSLAERVKNDPALLRRVLANPGLRSKLPAHYLTKSQRAKRELNTRMKAPIVPGSGVTEGQLARDSRAAMDTRYGAREAAEREDLGEETTRARDVGGPGGFYDQYLAQVAQHSKNIQAIGANAATAGQALQNGVTGLSAAGLTGLQNPATADAAARGATAGDLSGMANQATAIRQALTASFVAQQNAQNAGAQGYADTRANVVAPGQKLGAQVMAQGRVRKADQRITDTANERGAADYSYRADRRTDEGKSVLARQALGVKENAATADAAAAKANTYGPGGNKPNEWGFTYDEWQKMPATERNEWRSGTKTRAPEKAADDPVYSSGAFAGKTKSEVNGLTPEARQKIVDEYNKPAGEKPKGKAGPKWVTANESGSAMTQASLLKDYAKKAKDGFKFEPTGKEKKDPKTGNVLPGKRLTREEARNKLKGYVGDKLKHPALLDAAVDAVYNGFIQAPTVRALITAGYKPSEVARALGVKTSGEVKAGDRPGGNP